MHPRGPLCALRADGEEFQVEASVSHTVTGGRKLFTVILRDITDRLRTEEGLRTNEEMLRLLLDGIKDYAVYMVDPEGRVASWNAGAARIKGYSREEILGRPISIFYPPDQQNDGVPALALQEAIAKGRFEGQGTRIRKDGSTFLAQVVIVPMYDQAGKLRGFAKVLHDITQRVQTEEKLAWLYLELARHGSDELEAFAASSRDRETHAASRRGEMGEGRVAADEQGSSSPHPGCRESSAQGAREPVELEKV